MHEDEISNGLYDVLAKDKEEIALRKVFLATRNLALLTLTTSNKQDIRSLSRHRIGPGSIYDDRSYVLDNQIIDEVTGLPVYCWSDYGDVMHLVDLGEEKSDRFYMSQPVTEERYRIVQGETLSGPMRTGWHITDSGTACRYVEEAGGRLPTNLQLQKALRGKRFGIRAESGYIWAIDGFTVKSMGVKYDGPTFGGSDTPPPTPEEYLFKVIEAGNRSEGNYRLVIEVKK